MFLLTPTARGSLSSNTTGASHAPTVNATVPAGKVLFLRVATTSEPTVLTAGATNHHTGVTDTVGNTWVKVGEVTKDGSGVNISASFSLWLCHVVNAIPNGSAITVAFDATYKSRLSGLTEYTLEVPESTVAVAGVNVAHGAGSPLSVSLTLGAEDEYTWVGVGGYGNRNYVVTKDATFATDLAEIEVDDTNFNSVTMWGQYRAVQVATQAWANTTPTGGIRWGMVLGAITVTPPTPPPADPGTREVQADFETDTHAVDRVTTDRRPDAVSHDFRTAYTQGPDDLEDVSLGLTVRTWRVRADVGAVYLARANDAGTDFEPEVLLTTASGSAPIVELDVAFDVLGRIVVVAERPTGSGGTPQVSLYWYNPAGLTPGYEWKNLADGRSPRCVTDCFPTTVGGTNVCPPDVDVQVFYVKSSGATVRVEQSSNYSTEVATVLPTSSLVRLQKAFRTTDRRVSLLYSQRNLATGRYQFRRIDSKPYRDALLARPNLLNYSTPFLDLMQTGYLAWSDPADHLATNNWILRVQTQDDVDAIEIEGSRNYPAGALHPFTDYADEYAPGGGIGAGFFNDFAIPITHGYDADGDTWLPNHPYMSLVAFRARTRRTVLGETCYSPWRYMVVPTSYPLVTSPAWDDTTVHCDRDAHLDIPHRNDFERAGIVEGMRGSNVSARGDTFTYGGSLIEPCPEGFVSTPTGWYFVGGERNLGPGFPNPTHVQNWHVRRRAMTAVDFTDADGRYNVNIYGPVLESSSSGLNDTDAYVWPETQFPRQFPDDGGNIELVVFNPYIIDSKGDLLPPIP